MTDTDVTLLPNYKLGIAVAVDEGVVADGEVVLQGERSPPPSLEAQINDIIIAASGSGVLSGELSRGLLRLHTACKRGRMACRCWDAGVTAASISRKRDLVS